ncbi:UNVERIFIED_CONTAM: hypothetical protein Slati_3757800 [Sesamum latifolium]|uniref:Uncharacterized protein n=1 Tax=Sesamum latifolium TaxID=2727402 RepID=A0AAW2U2Y8_9LAMI
MPIFLCGVAIVVMEMTEFIELGALGAVFPRPGACQQPLSFYSHEGLCYGDSQRSVDGVHTLKGRLPVSHVDTGFLGGGLLLHFLSFFSATFFFGCLSILHINVFCGTSQKSIKLEDRLLGQGLEEVPIQKSFREGTSLHLLHGRGHFQRSSIGSLQVFLQGLVIFMPNSKEAELCLTQFSATSELMQEEGSELLKTSNGSYR